MSTQTLTQEEIQVLQEMEISLDSPNLKAEIKNLLKEEVTGAIIFNYQQDDKELREFIKTNFVIGKNEISQIQVDKNNFISIYNKWVQVVKPSLIVNWEVAKKSNIIDGDFYLADLLSDKNQSLKDNLYVLLKGDHYELDKKLDETGMFSSKRTNFNDNQKAHTQFWNRYKRPPKQQYWDYLVERRDLLVPQDIRERKGSFFTPRIWVEKSQEYLKEVLGENWQDEYYIWDCAAGTGNLLAGLTNKYNIYASTLDRADVDVMIERINNMNENSVDGQGSNLLHEHVFQFDFLNDSFEDEKVPKSLRDILQNPEKRKKLVIYINPPYAEHGNSQSRSGKLAKSGVATQTKVYEDFSNIVGTGTRELFTQFFLRIYKEIPGCYLSSFSTLKYANSQNFIKFRKYFLAEFKKGFIVPASTFDNVKGKFPIGFLIWDTSKKKKIEKIKVDVFDKKGEFIDKKGFYSFGKNDFISNWLRKYYDKESQEIGYLILPGVDMQAQNGVYITSYPTESDIKQHKNTKITQKNVIPMVIYLAVRHCIKATWLNDRDQFLFPNDGWKKDKEFQNDCLAFTLFHGQNRISSKQGTNHWIPFTENEVNAPERFESHFMTDFIGGKLATPPSNDTAPQKGNITPDQKQILQGILKKIKK